MSAAAAHFAWHKGGEATVTILDGDRITVVSTSPQAPGSRPEGALLRGGLLRVKVARCRKQEELFCIEGRLIDTTREVRIAIDGLIDQADA